MACHTRQSNRREPGFYRQLDRLSTADIYVDPPRSYSLCLPSSDSLPEGVYLIDRLVTSRKRKGATEYLVLWKDYPREDASWVMEGDVTSAAIRSYHNPTPELDAILDSVTNFKQSIDASLRVGSIRCYTFNVNFHLDVFRYLFSSAHGNKYYAEDFPEEYFPGGWSCVYDRLGDGCQVDFPIEIKPGLAWSGLCFNKAGDGTLAPRPRYFTEVVRVKLDKSHC